jgi:UDP-N-acetylglucosamine 2-epimerase (non-hydrolysing)
MSTTPFTVACIFGTRPDAIKMAPIIKEFAKHPTECRLVTISTGQHKEMLDQVLKVFDIQPDYDLGLMQPGQTLGEMTARAITALMPVLEKEKPDLVIAQGDTTTTFVASLAAFYAKAKFGHVEAGLRTDNKFDPYPEEMNRRMTTRLADFHFAPTTLSQENLLKEGVDPTTIRVTGNTVVDALNTVASQDYVFEEPETRDFLAKGGRMILVTAHRRENWGEPMKEVATAIRELVAEFPDVRVIFPMHRNPIVREAVVPILSNHERILLIEPAEYFPFVHLMKASYFVLTDSGGAQEEAPGLGKPVLVLRNTTERPEGVHSGNAKLVGTRKEVILTEARALLSDPTAYAAMSQAASPYGSGDSAQQIWQWISEAYSKGV